MASLSNYEAARLLNYSLVNSNVYLALFQTSPGAGGTGTEASGGGYARKPISFTTPAQSGNLWQIQNSANVDFGEFSADLGSIGFFGLYNAASGGNLLWYGAFDLTKTIQTGDSVVLPAGNLTVQLG